MSSSKIFSFDSEVNGRGKAFVIAAVVYQERKLVDSRTFYRGPDVVTDPWARENILPKLEGLEVNHVDYFDMLMSFKDFYLQHNRGADIVTHMAEPHQKRLFIDMSFFDSWEDRPSPLIDIAKMLKARGFDPKSVDSYNKEFGLMEGRVEAEGLASRHPLYDSIATAAAYMHLIG